MLRPMEALPGSGENIWELSDNEAGWYEVAFAEGTVLDRQAVAELGAELRAQNPDEPIRVLVFISGIVDVCPDVSAELATARASTRLALLGASQMDQVLSGFILSDLADPEIARYVETVDEAVAFLTGG